MGEPTGSWTMATCMSAGAEPAMEIYGGARAYHSRMLPRGPKSRESKGFCFVGDSVGQANTSDKLAPWRTYKDITIMHNDNDNGSSNDNDGDSGDGCSGDMCTCDGYWCHMHGGSQCSSNGCLCMGDDCGCSVATGCATSNMG